MTWDLGPVGGMTRAGHPPVRTRTADAPKANPPAARMDRVTKDFNGWRALADVTFAVPRGALVGVIGPSGAGKTTAISLFTGNLVPSSGSVQTLGENPLRLRRRTI